MKSFQPKLIPYLDTFYALLIIQIVRCCHYILEVFSILPIFQKQKSKV